MYLSVWFALLLAQQQEDFSEIKIQKLADGYRYVDSPVWTPDRKLIFTEPSTNTVYLWNPGQKPEPWNTESNGAHGLTYDTQDRLYLCETRARRVVRVDKKTGKRETIAEKWEGKRLNGPNDIVVRKDGHVYFTDGVFGSATDMRDLDFYGVFHISPKGEVFPVVRWKSGRPNGIALSPNGRHLYVSNADERKVMVLDLDRYGMVSNERTFIDKMRNGVPAGIRVDEKGNVYVAAHGLSIYTAEGKHLRDIELPESASNLGFGEGDLQSLFVTTRTSVYRIRVPFRGFLPYANPPSGQ